MSSPTNQDPAHIESSHQLPEHAGGSSSSGLRTTIILLVIVLVAAFVGWRIYVNKQDTAAEANNKAAQAANRPIPVQVVNVQAADGTGVSLRAGNGHGVQQRDHQYPGERPAFAGELY